MITLINCLISLLLQFIMSKIMDYIDRSLNLANYLIFNIFYFDTSIIKIDQLFDFFNVFYFLMLQSIISKIMNYIDELLIK